MNFIEHAYQDENQNPPILRFKKLFPNAAEPVRGTKFSAGLDLSACVSDAVGIPPRDTVKIGTGLSFEIPHGYFGAVFARSGLASKYGLRPANCVGVIDEDYRGEVIVAMHNDSDTWQTITPGERIAQLVLIPYLNPPCLECQDLDKTERGEGGFGSTGV